MRLKRPKLLGFLLLLFLPVLAWAGIASAQEFRTGNTTTVGSNEVIDSTLWVSGRTIDIAGEVRGDVFCAGQNVSISGTVQGDVICAAQTIHVSGTVDGDIRATGQTVSIGGEVTGNVTVAAQTATLESQGSVGGDASFAGQEATVHGTVSRDLSLATQSATIAGNVGRDVTATLDELTLTSEAEVGGEVSYTSSKSAEIADGAQVAGEVNRSEPAARGDSGISGFRFSLFVALALLVTALILVLLFPRAFHNISSYAVNSPVKTVLTGFVATIVAPVLIIGIMITVLGIPLGLITLMTWLLILSLSGPFAAYYVGRLVWRDQTSPVLIMLAGAIIVLALWFIPIVGMIVMLLAVWFGAGMILLELKNRFAKPDYDVKALK